MRNKFLQMSLEVHREVYSFLTNFLEKFVKLNDYM